MINADFSGDIEKARKHAQEFQIKSLLIEAAIETYVSSVLKRLIPGIVEGVKPFYYDKQWKDYYHNR